MYKFLSHRSVQVLLAVTLYLVFASHLPQNAHFLFYTCSLCIKDLLVWLLPLTVAIFIGGAVSSFEKKAPLFLVSLFIFEALSNMSSVWYAYGWGNLATQIVHPIETKIFLSHFAPLWRLPLTKPIWWSADKGMLCGVALGLIATFTPRLKQFLLESKQVGEKILTQFFGRLIPLFVLGFVARMHQTELLHQMIHPYASLLGWLTFALTLYIAFLFLLGGGEGSPSFFKRIQNLAPAAAISFSSGCSLSTMPWTIEGAAKNLKNRSLASAIIPATTNIQQIGDCIINSFLCVVLCAQFQGAAPDLATWMVFSFWFVLARFATAAVLGGAIFVMLPIYESVLHFTPEMISIILALNVILDPLVTCSNVVANGALCRLFERTLLFGDFLVRNPNQKG